MNYYSIHFLAVKHRAPGIFLQTSTGDLTFRHIPPLPVITEKKISLMTTIKEPETRKYR